MPAVITPPAERVHDRIADRSVTLAEHLTVEADTRPGYMRLIVDGRYLYTLHERAAHDLIGLLDDGCDLPEFLNRIRCFAAGLRCARSNLGYH